MLISRTPFRISLFGGGTDLSVWLDQSPGKVFSFAINKYCFITLRELNEFFNYKYAITYHKKEHVNKIEDIKHPVVKNLLKIFEKKTRFEIEHKSDLPARSGIGSSSTFTVGLLNSLNFYKNNFLSKKKLCNLAINFEQNILKESVGMQDQIRASYGGIGFINFKKNKFQVNNILKSHRITQELEKNCFLVYTDIARTSSKVEKKKIQLLKKNIEAKNNMKKIYEIACEAEEIIKSENYEIKDIGMLLSEQWKFKKNLLRSISNNKIEEIYDFVMTCGAYGGKLLGAGAGGFFIFLGNDRVIKKIKFKNTRLKVIKIKIDYLGSIVIETKL